MWPFKCYVGGIKLVDPDLCASSAYIRTERADLDKPSKKIDISIDSSGHFSFLPAHVTALLQPPKSFPFENGRYTAAATIIHGGVIFKAASSLTA